MQDAPDQSLAQLIAGLSADDRYLLHKLLQNQCDVYRAAADSDISVLDYLLWYDKPAIRAAIDGLDQLSEKTLQIRANRARITAINLLEHTAVNATDTTERRRASTALVRATMLHPPSRVSRAAAVRERTGASPAPTSKEHCAQNGSINRMVHLSRCASLEHAGPAADTDCPSPAPQHAAEPALPPSPAIPDYRDLPPGSPPELLLAALLIALANNDSPEPHTGLTLLHAASAGKLELDGTRFPESLDRFIEAARASSLAPLLGHTTRLGIDVADKIEDAQLFTTAVIPAGSKSHIRYWFNFARDPRNGEGPNRWYLTHIYSDPPP